MKKLKGFYKNNRIYCILMGISILCLAVIALILALYFINQTKSSVYGNRLNGIENATISDSHKNEIIEFITSFKNVEKASVNIKGKIIYINTYLKSGKVEDAQNIAIKSLEKLTEDEKNFYDINFSFVRETTDEEDTTFPLMGYKKSNEAIISWKKVNGE